MRPSGWADTCLMSEDTVGSLHAALFAGQALGGGGGGEGGAGGGEGRVYRGTNNRWSFRLAVARSLGVSPETIMFAGKVDRRVGPGGAARSVRRRVRGVGDAHGALGPGHRHHDATGADDDDGGMGLG